MQNLCLTFCKIKVSESLLSCLIFSFRLPNVIKPAVTRVHIYSNVHYFGIDMHMTCFSMIFNIYLSLTIYFVFSSDLVRVGAAGPDRGAGLWRDQVWLRSRCVAHPLVQGQRHQAHVQVIVISPRPRDCVRLGTLEVLTEHCGNWERVIVGDIYWEITAKTFLKVTRCSIISRKKPNSYEMPLYQCTGRHGW